MDYKLLKSVADSLPVSINIFDVNGKRIWVNPFYYHLGGKMTNAKVEEFLTIDGIHKNIYLNKKIKAAIEKQQTFDIKNFYYRSRSNKTIRYLDIHLGPIILNKKNVVGAYSMAYDVTTRYLARKKLVRLKNMLEKMVKDRTNKLEKANVQLREMYEEKNVMIADIAHEIKTILTIIQGNIEMIEMSQLNQKSASKSYEMECRNEVKSEIGKMNSIVSNLVFVSKAKEFEKLLKMEKINLALIIKDSISNFKKLAIGNLKIKFINLTKIKKDSRVMADESKMRTLINNLIENSLKFSKKNGHLDISLQAKKNVLLITFQDDGVGIEKQNLINIFNPFFRVDKSRSARKENGNKATKKGFGLGLAICKRIVEAHKGEIVVKSEGINKGSAFEISLPLANK